ncbi:MAG: endolytic transglycosylase MltG [Flavobacteriales bacterium]|nr:endolytic transglycosylase MltG [Flavobacteriales bacterium]
MKKSFLLIAFLIIVGLIYFSFPYYNLFKAKNLDNLDFKGSEISLEIDNDILFKDLGEYLKQEGIIKDDDAFNLLVNYKKGYSHSTLTKGKITIKREWLNNELVNQLYLMRNQKIISITIPTFRKLEDLANFVSRFIEDDSTELLSVLTDLNVSSSYGFNLDQFPCMFIPNTYEIYSNYNSIEFVSFMAKEYKKFWNEDRKLKADSINLTQSEVSILASIVQCEQSLKYDEHSKIAGLYLNRINKDMKLQADPTVKFALDMPGLRRLYYRHLEVNSPYNTYKFKGLPPGPICIPDSRVIDAVLNYEQHDFIFMCAQPAYSGYHNFSSTNYQHEKYKKLYTNWLKSENIH